MRIRDTQLSLNLGIETGEANPVHTIRFSNGKANKLGYEIVRTDLFRTRLATATREQLREEVVVLHWPGERIVALL